MRIALLLLLAAPSGALAQGDAAAARTRVVVLPLQAPALPPEELDPISRTLVDGFRADPGVEVVDALPMLGDKAADDWLKADKLLYDGIQDYQDLEFVKAVEQLRESAEIMERTFREFADSQGRRRMRDAYLHLGLSRLEQGEQMEADDWFAKAANIDPSFRPDPRAFPPAVRTKFLTMKSVDRFAADDDRRLRALAALVGVDLVVAGGVKQEAADWVVVIAWVDRWSPRSGVHPVKSLKKETLSDVIRRDGPMLVAKALERPWPPSDRGPRTRRRFAVGAAGALMPGARIRKDAGGNQVYRWNDDIEQGGVHFGLSPWERGAWAVEADVSLYLPRRMSDGGWNTQFDASGQFEGGGSLGAHLLHSFRAGRWGVTPGVGFALNQSIASFRSPQTRTGVVFVWGSPVVSLSAQRTLTASEGLETYLEVELSANYDALGSGPAPLLLQSVASGGVAF